MQELRAQDAPQAASAPESKSLLLGATRAPPQSRADDAYVSRISQLYPPARFDVLPYPTVPELAVAGALPLSAAPTPAAPAAGMADWRRPI